SAHIDFEEENNELQDEVDTFHAANRKLAPNAYKKKKAKKAEEVLNVEADESEEEMQSESDFDDDSGTESYSVVDNEWGRKRKDFYGTEYVDEDWGGMREEELEDAELEEEDAAGRQAALDKAAALAAELFENEEKTAENQSCVKETVFEWKFPAVKKLNKRTVGIIEEYNRRKDLMKVIVEPLAAVVEILPKNSNVRKQLLLVHDVYTTYILNLMFFLQLKAEALSKKNATDEMVDTHPVLERIEKFSEMIKRVDAFLDKNASALKKLVRKVSSGEPIENIVVEQFPERTVQKKVMDALEGENYENVEGDLADNEFLSPEERRKANKQIEKNFNAELKGRKKKTPRIAKVGLVIFLIVSFLHVWNDVVERIFCPRHQV
ncbi:Sas10/Utp3/C1D family protein, partial [Necator americanus]